MIIHYIRNDSVAFLEVHSRIINYGLNIFNRFLGFDNIDIIHSFLSVHGVIQGYTNPKADYHIYSERNSRGMRYITWLTTWLYENGLIESRPDNTDYDESSHFIPINLDKIAEYIKENGLYE